MPETSPPLAATTYAQLTVQGIFAAVDILLPKEKTIDLIHQKEAIYHRFLEPFCKHILNQRQLDYCQAMIDYGIHEINFIRHTYEHHCRVNGMTYDNSSPLLNQMHEYQDRIQALSARHLRLTQEESILFQEMKGVIKDLLKEWQSLQKGHATSLTQSLLEEGCQLPAVFESRLTELLTEQLVSLKKVSVEVKRRFKLKAREPSVVEQALIHLLYEENPP